MHTLIEHYQKLSLATGPDEPGFSVVFSSDGVPLLEKHHGLACLELGAQLSGKSAYYLASESKPFTAMCMMHLVSAGAISLDQNVVELLPALAQYETPVLLRHLLNHTSGIPDYLWLLECQLGRHESDYFNNQTALELIRRADTLDFVPGEKFAYSNSNYVLLAALIEQLSGMSAASYAAQTLFHPLGMHNTGFDEDRASIIRNRVRSYDKDETRPFGYQQHLGNANTVGDGGVYSCTDDLQSWQRELHRQWQDKDSLLHMMLLASPLNDGTVISYRFGLELITQDGIDYLYHQGRLWGFTAILLLVPQKKLSLIQLANSDQITADHTILVDLVQQALAV